MDIINAYQPRLDELNVIIGKAWPGAKIYMRRDDMHQDTVPMVIDPAEMNYSAKRAYKLLSAMGGHNGGKRHTYRKANRVIVRIADEHGMSYTDIVKDMPLCKEDALKVLKRIVNEFVATCDDC